MAKWIKEEDSEVEAWIPNVKSKIRERGEKKSPGEEAKEKGRTLGQKRKEGSGPTKGNIRNRIGTLGGDD